MDFVRKEMSYDKINIRNEFCMPKLVENDFLIIFIAQQIKHVKDVLFPDGGHLGLHIATSCTCFKIDT